MIKYPGNTTATGGKLQMKEKKRLSAASFDRALFWRTAIVSLALTLAIEMFSRHSIRRMVHALQPGKFLL